MPNILCGIVESGTRQVRDCYIDSITMTSRFQHRNIQHTTLRQELEMCWIMLHKNTRISEINVPEILDSDHLPI
jgi:hypothetical protein